MPLKHFTETFLVFALGVVMVLAGVVCVTLPSLPQGLLPWAVVFAVSLLYPIVLSPLFRKRRADYAFRLLHWFPSAILLVWLGLEAIVYYRDEFAPFLDWYTWAWALPVVALGFLLLMSFCLQVIRRRIPRILLLLIAFVPFAAGAVWSERGPHWEQELAAVVWQGDWWQVDYGDILPAKPIEVAQRSSASSFSSSSIAMNLQPSQDPSEQAWRDRLRSAEERRTEVRKGDMKSEGSSASAVSSDASTSSQSSIKGDAEKSSKSASSRSSSGPMEVAAALEVLSGTGKELREAESKPERLPQSGAGFGLLGFLTVAGYAGTIHVRARKRV